MSLDMIAPLLTSMTTPLAATVIKSARPWLSAQREDGGATGDRGKSVEVKTISKAELATAVQAGEDAPSAISEPQLTVTKKAVGPKPAAHRVSAPKLDAANVVTQSQQIVVSPVFKLVFLTVVALTVLSGASAVVMAFVGDGVQPNQQAVFESMNTGWKLGLGAIFGLLGGKAA